MKIGIITMHRVQNYGSALQAFALVEYLGKLGHHVETIDYFFPNSYHLKKTVPSLKARVILKIREILRSLLLEPFLKRNSKFALFRKQHLHLTDETYKTKEELMQKSPKFDVYLTGSDQVWNESKIFNDDSFFCDFALKDKKIISFGASITTNKLTDTYAERLKKQLAKYSAIGVREKSSLPLIQMLGLPQNIQVLNTCDPTLLLESTDYDKLASESKIKIDYDYILVHQLEYNFSAEPAISEVIDSAKKHYGCGIIMIDHMFKKLADGDHKVCNLGPNEFIWLFKHAKAIVTSSFHGTMFSVIYRKPFISIAPPKGHLDSRITDTLVGMGLTDHLVYNDGRKIGINWNAHYTDIQEKQITAYIEKSKEFLKENL